MAPSRAWFWLGLSVAAFGCAAAPEEPRDPSKGTHRPDYEIHRYRISSMKEAIAVRDNSGCWVRGNADGVNSSLSLRYPDAVCSSKDPPDWMLAEDIRSDGTEGPLPHLYEPIPFLPSAAGLALARRFLALEQQRDPGRAEGLPDLRWHLDLYSEDGLIHEERMPALCDAGNPVACLRGADAATWAARAERACMLDHESSCRELAYQRYLAALAAGRRTSAFPAYRGELCATCFASAPGQAIDHEACAGHDTRFLGSEGCPAKEPAATPVAENAAAGPAPSSGTAGKAQGGTDRGGGGPAGDAAVVKGQKGAGPGTSTSKSLMVAGGPPSRADVLSARRDAYYAAVQRTPEHASLVALLCAKGVSLAGGGLGIFDPRLFQGIACPEPAPAPAKTVDR